jgi:acyl dehydratase
LKTDAGVTVPRGQPRPSNDRARDASAEDVHVAVDTSVIGKPVSASKVRVERGPIAYFASAVKDENPVFHDPAAARAAGFADLPAPPTFTFAMQHMGKTGETQPPDPTDGSNPMHEVMGKLYASGGMVLHGEQEFEYHRPIVVGDVLTGDSKILDAYERESKGKTMTFIVMETVWRDEQAKPVVTERFNLIHRK